MEPATLGQLSGLLEYFCRNAYKVRDRSAEVEFALKRCLELFEKDYTTAVIENRNGDLCGHYPSDLVIPLKEKNQDCTGVDEKDERGLDSAALRDHFAKSRFARCRSRFVMPVILVDGKYVCRSSTLASGAEMYGRSGMDYFFSGGEGIPSEADESPQEPKADSKSIAKDGEWQLFDRVRGQDIKLLERLSVNYICDLMVEKKKVKFGMHVTSSEKVDKGARYQNFQILTIPYPGCEFFREFREKEYDADNIHFDWCQAQCDSRFEVPEDLLGKTRLSKLEWDDYKTWDLAKITRAYLELLLSLTEEEGNKGLLIHCISGWDRTPLFVSLLRLSLWADGRIHKSLSPLEILYLTIAYDWFLFGHNLPDRLAKGEEVFFFCFHFLKYITGDEYATVRHKWRRRNSTTDSESNYGYFLLDKAESCTSLNSVTSNSSKSAASSLDAQTNVFCQCSNGDLCVDADTNAKTPACKCSTPPHSATLRSSSGRKYSFSRVVNGNVPRASPESLPHAGEPSFYSYNGSSSCPVSVPQRPLMQDACHGSYGSWQIIWDSPSPHGYESSRESPFLEPVNEQNGTPPAFSFESNGSVVHSFSDSENARLEGGAASCTTRKSRLERVREIFFKAYGSATNSYQKNGSTAGLGLGALLDQFAERVGLK